MLDSLLNSRVAEAPTLFNKIVVTARNKSWIPQDRRDASGQDDALVVVGAGHLVGKQGVVAMLKAKGYTVEQM